MRIKNIEIDGYRSLKNTKIEDLSDINIFHGSNNSGKSNILRALDLFFSEKVIIESIFEQEIGEEVEESKLVKTGFKGEIPLDYSDFYNYQEAPIKFTVEVELKKKEIETINKKLKKESTDKLPIKDKLSILISALISHDLITREGVRYGIFTIDSFKIDGNEYGKNKKYTDLIDKTGLNLIEKFTNINSDRQIVLEIDKGVKEKINGKNIQKYLYNLSLSDDINDRKILREIVDRFNEINKKIGTLTFSKKHLIPEEEIGYVEHGAQKIIFKDRNEIKLFIISPDYNVILPIDNIGSGVQQSLIILANIVAKKKTIFYGIEELEENLSPDSQYAVFKTLLDIKNKQDGNVTQFFITSHSAVFKNANKTECKAYFVNLKDKRTDVKEMTIEEYKNFFKKGTAGSMCFECYDGHFPQFMDAIKKKLNINEKEAKVIEREICVKCSNKNIYLMDFKTVKKFKESELDKKIAK